MPGSPLSANWTVPVEVEEKFLTVKDFFILNTTKREYEKLVFVFIRKRNLLHIKSFQVKNVSNGSIG